MQQRLHLLAQAAHALEMAQHPQRDEVPHAERPPQPLGTAHPREHPFHGGEQLGKHGLVGEAMHQGHESVADHWGHTLWWFCNTPARPH
jgi:hypothetical protein